MDRSRAAATQTNRSVVEIGGRLSELDGIVDTIEDITAQTNLLALNATIDAAYAGIAGRSFAVVAGEVKELARLAQSSTKEIAEQFVTFRKAIAGMTRDIDLMTEASVEVEEITEAVDVAIRDQRARVESLSESGREVTALLRGFVDDVAQAGSHASVSARGAREVLESARRVETDIETVRRSMRGFVHALHGQDQGEASATGRRAPAAPATDHARSS